jgi:CHAT domain-containing protein
MHSRRKTIKNYWNSTVKYTVIGILGLCLTLIAIPVQAHLSLSSYSEQVPVANSINRLEQGRTLYDAGRFTEAAEIWKKAAQIYAEGSDRLNQALSLSYLSLAHQELSQWVEAKQAIEKSLSILRDPQIESDAVLLAQALNTQASLLLHTGQINSALETWQQAADYYHQVGDSLGELGSQINQAQALQSLGFYRRSKQQLEEVSQRFSGLPDSTLKAAGLRQLGMALQVMGDLSRSREILLESLAIAERIGATIDRSATLLSLGHTATDWGDRQAALSLFEQAEQAALTPTEQLQARLNLLHLDADEGNVDKLAALAPQIYQQLIELSPSHDSIYASINLAANLTHFEQQILSSQQLSQLLASAVKSAKDLQDPQAEAYALNQWGKLYIQTQQWTEAYSLTQKSLAIARTLQSDDIASQSAWQLGRILKQQGKSKEAIAAYTEAVSSLQSLRRDLAAINPNIQFSFRASVEPVYRELVALLLNDHPDQAALTQARQLIESLQLAELDNFFREACLDAQPQQIDQLDPHAAVVYPIILPDRLAVILSVAGQPLHYYASPILASDVNRTLQDFLASIHPVSDQAVHLRLSQQIYDWLIRPAEKEQFLTNTKTLVFVLDGVLRKVPIATLHDGSQYLIEKYAVTLSPGLQLLVARSLNPQTESAVVAGISESRNGFRALPAVVSEVKALSQLIPSSTLLNQEFTVEALTKRIQNSEADIIHLATHGQFSSRLEDTFLLAWDGQINVQELSSLLQKRSNNHTIELLVLSACDTATGDDRAALGLAGLAVKSGARSTLATLWPVQDTAAAILMNQFYQNLQIPGITKAEALRKAQLALMADGIYADPFFWSPFVLVGNWL